MNCVRVMQGQRTTLSSFVVVQRRDLWLELPRLRFVDSEIDEVTGSSKPTGSDRKGKTRYKYMETYLGAGFLLPQTNPPLPALRSAVDAPPHLVRSALIARWTSSSSRLGFFWRCGASSSLSLVRTLPAMRSRICFCRRRPSARFLSSASNRERSRARARTSAPTSRPLSSMCWNSVRVLIR